MVKQTADVNGSPGARAQVAAVVAADEAAAHATSAASSAGQAAGHATDAANSVNKAAGHAAVAQAAEARLNRPTGFTYTLVIAILGATLIGLIVGDMISALTGNHVVDTSLMSATTLIAGGLIGVLAPSPK